MTAGLRADTWPKRVADMRGRAPLGLHLLQPAEPIVRAWLTVGSHHEEALAVPPEAPWLWPQVHTLTLALTLMTLSPTGLSAGGAQPAVSSGLHRRPPPCASWRPVAGAPDVAIDRSASPCTKCPRSAKTRPRPPHPLHENTGRPRTPTTTTPQAVSGPATRTGRTYRR
jgi:hypothetical protein